MAQTHTLAQTQPSALQQLQVENDQLKKYLAAQKVVIASLERRVGRSLHTLETHLQPLVESHRLAPDTSEHLNSIQNEVNSLCDLIADTMLLQKLEAGKVAVKLEPLVLETLLASVSRHLLEPKDGSAARLICEIEPPLPLAFADQELTEAVLTDLLARSLRYSDADSVVILGAEHQADRIHLRITAQRFAPAGNRDFATEIILCCRRIEVQRGTVTCQQHPDGLQTVTISLYTATRLPA
ncbi:MAG: sensor histidine kinase [Leptolyngbya sp. BL-A-14]